jgi:hypothetical protein
MGENSRAVALNMFVEPDGTRATMRNDFGVFRSATTPRAGIASTKEKPRRATGLEGWECGAGFAGQHVRIGAAASGFLTRWGPDHPSQAACCLEPRPVVLLSGGSGRCALRSD